ncbi:hypothetical protein CSUI_004402 [Cystoisospora suis]|uniref:Uncharacterized protein n=1 Tax=Cystoisospora suis TaxID=483139 RepID=A0A2C6KMP8_9APIC|nr:hypothetical protein CSUI_004402 [Cystoisospora suis]
MWCSRRCFSLSSLPPPSVFSLQSTRRVVQRQRLAPPDAPSLHPSHCRATQANTSSLCCMQTRVPLFSSQSGTSCRSFPSFPLSSGASPRHPSRAYASVGRASSPPPCRSLFLSSIRPLSSSRLYHHTSHSSPRTPFCCSLPFCPSSPLSSSPSHAPLRQVPANASCSCCSSSSPSELPFTNRKRTTLLHDRENTAPPLSPFFFSPPPSWCRSAHKFAAPPCPNLLLLRRTLQERFHPILFHIKNDTTMGNYVYDQHFKGILCSPLFEGKSYKEINAMVGRVLEDIGMNKSRVKLHCQPPSLMPVST